MRLRICKKGLISHNLQQCSNIIQYDKLGVFCKWIQFSSYGKLKRQHNSDLQFQVLSDAESFTPIKLLLISGTFDLSKFMYL